MKKGFINQYLERVVKTKSVLCVGLDPTIEHVPPEMRTGDDIRDIREYLFEIINIAADRVPVIKPQYAFYGALGIAGIVILQRVIDYAHRKGLLVILDAKRNDIGSTMIQYGKEVFGKLNVDACTFTPYLGSTWRAWMPWLKEGKMIISMIRTSNPEAEDIQDLELKGGRKLYEYMARLVGQWNQRVMKETNGLGGIGGVVGATWPEEAVECRKLAGDEVFFLIPGYGAQGGGAMGAVAGLLNSQEIPMGTVNSSRGITWYSWWDKKEKKPRKGDPIELVEKAIESANKDLNEALKRRSGHSIEEITAEI